MTIKLEKEGLLGIIIFLILINYQIITIVFHDPIYLKYMRDFLLILLLLWNLKRMNSKTTINFIFFIVITILAIISTLRAPTISIGILSLRKYLYPLLLFNIAIMLKWDDDKKRNKFLYFLYIILTILSLWGVFQALVLKDTFLKNIGYPTGYSYGYKKIMLKNSFYFGGFGFQRVVATLSNSNEFGLILGASIIYLLGNFKKIDFRYKKQIITVLLGAYVLTFSRSNFLAMLVIFFMILYPYIQNKKSKFIVGLFILSIFFIFVCLFGNNIKIIQQMQHWIESSVSFQDASAAGRTIRWTAALETLKENPLGLGFGYVGSISRDAGLDYISCENSYLAMALDFGVFGMIAYIIYFVILIKWFRKRKFLFKDKKFMDESRMCAIGEAIIIYFMVAMFFSNYIQDLEAMVIMYLFTAIIYKYVSKKENELLIQ